MRRAYLPLALVLLVWLASRCSHTETVTRQAPEAAAHTQAGDGKTAAKSRRTGGGDGDGDEGPRKRGDRTGDRTNEDDAAEPPPLATSPAGLLQPHAAEALQDQLIARGYLDHADRSGKLDGKTQRALREFQREQGMPATGIPDDLTVQKLGLSPSDVFRSTNGSTP